MFHLFVWEMFFSDLKHTKPWLSLFGPQRLTNRGARRSAQSSWRTQLRWMVDRSLGAAHFFCGPPLKCIIWKTNIYRYMGKSMNINHFVILFDDFSEIYGDCPVFHVTHHQRIQKWRCGSIFLRLWLQFFHYAKNDLFFVIHLIQIVIIRIISLSDHVLTSSLIWNWLNSFMIDKPPS